LAHNFNAGDKTKLNSNLKIFEEVKKFAKVLNNPYVVIHPGQGELQDSIDCINKLDYKNLIIENMPKIGINHKLCLGFTADDMKQFLKSGFNFCLDFSHAIKAAKSLAIDPKELISQLMQLNPTLYHISDGYIDSELDEHLKLGKGDFNLDYIKKAILKSNSRKVTFETPRKNNEILDEVSENINYFANL